MDYLNTDITCINTSIDTNTSTLQGGTPLLIEDNVKKFLNKALINCNIFKKKYYDFLINIFIFILFIIILFLILYFRYKGKLTPEENKIIEENKKKYILSKIKNYEQNRLKQNQNLFTDLPYF